VAHASNWRKAGAPGARNKFDGTRDQVAHREVARRGVSRHQRRAQGLVAQGRTIQETIEIARDVARKLIEAQSGDNAMLPPPARESFDYPLIVGT
jgi:hypothetical protein